MAVILCSHICTKLTAYEKGEQGLLMSAFSSFKRVLRYGFCIATLLSGCSKSHKGPTKSGLSEKQNWVVKSEIGKTKNKNQFDVIVAGSGIGGLTTASLLSKQGYKVLVLEQQAQVGGYCSSFVRGGFTFPVGVTDVSGLWKHGRVAALLDTLGLKKEMFFVLNKRLIVLKDKKILLAGTKKDLVDQLSLYFPKEKASILSFLQEAEQALIEMYTNAQQAPTLLKWQKVSFQQKLDEFFKEPDIQAFFRAYLCYLGMKSDHIRANQALAPCLGYLLFGGYSIKGGPQHFANALKMVIEKQGGIVLLNTKVDEILLKEGAVVGVRSGRTIFQSPLVVSNVNAKTTFLHLLPKGALNQPFLDAISHLKMSQSACVVNLGVDLDLSKLPSHITLLDQNHSFTLVVNSSADPSLAPKRKASITIFCKGKYSETPLLDTPEYARFKEKIAEKAVAQAEKLIPELRAHIVVKDVITPRSLEHFTSMPKGALYAFEQSSKGERPFFKTPIKGLYLASSSTHPGGGVESVVSAGFLCARDILSSNKP